MARPEESWNGFIGQRHIVCGIDRLIRGSRAGGELFPDLLLLGNSGLGKTRFFQILLGLIGTKLHQLMGRKVVTLFVIGLMTQGWAVGDILFINQRHSLSHEIQECLYRIIDERQAPRVESHAVTDQPTLNGGIKGAAVTILLEPEQAGALLSELKKRFTLIFEFQPIQFSNWLPSSVNAREKGMLL